MNEITQFKTHDVSEPVTDFNTYLKELGLPSENVIAPISDRSIVINSLPQVLTPLPSNQIGNSLYLSRFAAAASIGLFDAALNYIWDEVIKKLREKAVLYGLDEFYDIAVSPKKRNDYHSEEQLRFIRDKTLLDTFKQLEWMNEILYKNLVHILDMRNLIAASHPNEYQIRSYQLLSWLDTCVKDVLCSEPSSSAIEINKLLANLKSQEDLIDNLYLESLKSNLSGYPSTVINNLLNSLLGIYTRSLDSNVKKKNILKIAKEVWPRASDQVKYEIGNKLAQYRSVLDTKKAGLVDEFLDGVSGLNYVPKTEKSLRISNLCDDLKEASEGYNNFYNEPSIIQEIMKYLGEGIDIPEDQEEKLLKIVLSCRIGREVNYCHGVSPSGKISYNEILSSLTQKQTLTCISILKDILPSCLSGGIKEENGRQILQILLESQANERVKEVLSYMVSFKNLTLVFKDAQFNRLMYGLQV